MRIAIDIQPLVSASQERGMGVYTLGLLREMFRQDQENEYYLFNLYGDCILEQEPLPKNVHHEKFYMGKNHNLLHLSEDATRMRYSELMKGLFQTFIRKNQIDVFFITSPFDQWMIYETEWFAGCKVACIFYDLIPYIFKKEYLQGEEGRKYMQRLAFVRQADMLLAISHSAKADLIEHLNMDADKIAVINSGISSTYCKKDFLPEEKEKVFTRYQIADEYLLFPSGCDFRKNADVTIRGYAKMPRELIDKYQLVITGSAPQAYAEEMQQLCKKLGIPGRVIFTDHISYDDLLLLYNNTRLVVFTSLYEGFGLPVIEAFICGKDVVTSNNSSLGEVAEGAAVLVDPFREDDIARGFEEALTKLDCVTFEQAKQEKLAFYTWENSSREALRALSEIGIEKERNVPSEKRMKIAMFTPLTPMESGISDYSEDLINELCRYCDIDVYIDEGYEAKKQFPFNVTVCPHTMFSEHANQYDDVVYQMGGSHFHQYMLPYMEAYPGTLVQHDLNLHNMVFVLFAQNANRWDIYKKFLSYEVEDAEKFVQNMQEDKAFAHTAIGEVVVNRFVVEPAKKIIVHSDYSREKLLEKNIGYQVKMIPLYAKVEQQLDVRTLREKHGIPQDTIMIASFGHAAVIKRIIPCVQAIKKISAERTNVKYWIVGQVHEREISDYIRESNMEQQVEVTGYVQDISTFKEYIAMADICLNLRYPYYGETSGSAMRILAAGKPLIVTDIGAFSEIPDDCCLKVGFDEKTEAEEISHAIQNLIKDQDYAEAMGKRARAFAEKTLDIRKIAKQYYEFIASDTYACLTEELLQKIYFQALTPLELQNDRVELERLSETLSYLITPDSQSIDSFEKSRME